MFAAAFFVGWHHSYLDAYTATVRAFEGGPASHAELVLSDGRSASATALDKGVRYLPNGAAVCSGPDWVLVPMPAHLEAPAIARVDARLGQGYDYRGNLRFVIPWGNRDSRNKAYCIELVLDALGFEDAWRYGVNTGMSACKRLAHAGGL